MGMANSFKNERGSFLARAENKPEGVVSPGTGGAGSGLGGVDINDRSLRQAASFGSGGAGDNDRNWLNFGGRPDPGATMGGAAGARPTTAATSNAKVVHLENQLKEERR